MFPRIFFFLKALFLLVINGILEKFIWQKHPNSKKSYPKFELVEKK